MNNYYWNKIGNFVKFIWKVSMRWKNWSDFKAIHSFPTFARSWRNAEPFSGNAEPQRGTAKYLGHAWCIGKRVCKSHGVFFSTLSAGVKSMEIWGIRTHITTWKPNTKHSSGTEMPVRTVSQKFIRPQWGMIFRELWGRTTTADFGSSFWQLLHVSDICLLEDKIQVCTCSQFLAEAMHWIKEGEMVDSVDNLKSSCSVGGMQIPDFEALDAKIASALNWIIHNTRFKRKVKSGGNESSQRRPFLSWKTGRLPDLRVLPGRRSHRFCRVLCRLAHNCSSKWRYSGIRFEMTRNFVINDENPDWWHLGRIVQIKNTRVWETQDLIGIVWPGDSSEEGGTWLSQMEDDGVKKYRAESTN